MLLNLYDYGMNLDNALAAAADGDRIYLPTGIYQAPAAGWKIAKSVELFGDGVGQPGPGGTILTGYNSTSDILQIAPAPHATLGPIYLHDLKIVPPGLNGIRFVMDDADQAVESVRLARVVIQNLSGNGFSINPSAGIIKSLNMLLCAAGGCGGYGIIMKNVRLGRSVLGASGGDAFGGVFVDASGMAVHHFLTGGDATNSAATQGQVLFKSCPVAHMASADLERFWGLDADPPIVPVARPMPVKVACEFRACNGAAAFIANFCNESDSHVDVTALLISSDTGLTPNLPAGPTTILANWFGSEGQLISVSSSAKGVVALSEGQSYSGAGDIAVPGDLTQSNGGLWGSPYIRRPPAPGIVDTTSGLIVPSRGGLPSSPLQNGMLFYDTIEGALAVRIGTLWKYVSTS